MVSVHQLVAYQKYGAIALSDNAVVRHLDSNSKNNKRGNISVGTRREDYYDIPEEVRLKRARKGAAVQRKLTSEQAEELRADRAAGATYAQLIEKIWHRQSPRFPTW